MGYLHTQDAYVCNDSIFFSELRFNGLFRYDQRYSKTECVMLFPEEFFWGNRIHFDVVRNNNELHFFPLCGHNIHIYNMETKKCDNLNISSYKCDRGEEVFLSAINYRDGYMLIPKYNEVPFAYYRIKEKQIENLIWINELVEYNYSEIGHIEYQFGTGLIIKGQLYLTLANRSEIIIVDLEQKNISIKNFEDEKIGNIYHYSDKIWLNTLGRNTKVICWDYNNNHVEKYEISPHDEAEKKLGHFIGFDNHLFIVPFKSNLFLKFDFEANEWTNIFDNIPKIFNRLYDEALFYGSHVENNKVVLFPKAGNGMLILHLEDYSFEFVEMRFDETELVKYFDDINQDIKLEMQSANFMLHEDNNSCRSLGLFAGLIGII